jgi:AcrR family transcriptional regulator
MKAIENGHDRRHAARGEEIVTAATDIFFEKGYGRTSMDDIIKAIGGSKRTLYSHFPGKDALFAAIVRKISSEALSNFRPKLEGEFETDLRDMGLQYLDVLLKPRTISLFRAMVSEAPHFPNLAKTFFENGPNRVSSYFAQFFEAHNRKGIYRTSDPDLVARQFLGMIRGDIHMAAVLTLEIPAKKELRQTVDNAVATLMNCAVQNISTSHKRRCK